MIIVFSDLVGGLSTDHIGIYLWKHVLVQTTKQQQSRLTALVRDYPGEPVPER